MSNDDSIPQSLETCDYCGLPLSPGWWGRAKMDRPAYCCSGCRIASAVTGSRGAEGQTRWMLARLGLAIFLTMNVMVFTMALWSGDVYESHTEANGALSILPDLFRYLGLVFSLPVLFLLGEPLVESAWQAFRHGQLATDVLIVVGVAAAYIYSALSTVRGYGHVYFEVGCIVLVVVSIGRWLEATGKLKTNETLDGLAKLLPTEVRRCDGRIVPSDEVAVGDLLCVVPGERFAVDGKVISGSCEVDEQIISGESGTVVKLPGAVVFSGTLNMEGDILLRVTAAAGHETVSRMIELVRRAREARGSYQRAADAVTTWFVPGVVLVALATLIWHATQGNVETGLLAMLAVALIACPCALGLATPMAVWAAMGSAARRQILFQNGEVIERLARSRAVRFDKTGTLTTGFPEVSQIYCDSSTSRHEALRRAGRLAAGSGHVLAGAIRRFLPHTTTAEECADLHNVAGCGIEGRLRNECGPTYLGNPRWLRERGCEIPGPLAQALAVAEVQGQSYSVLGWDGAVRALFIFRESIREQAAEALSRCEQLGLDVAVLTGDHPSRAAILSQLLNVQVVGGLLPHQKVEAIHLAQRAIGPVVMVGDGVNDAPALTSADVGVAMGCGADLSRSTAGVCLLGNDLVRLPEAIELARLTLRVIRQNLFWAFSYNTVGIVLAAVGWLNPVFAAIAMAVSSVLVVGNSLRIVGFGPNSMGESAEVAREPIAAHQRTAVEPAAQH
ncbi:MAG: cation-translocating P-type ATPase [Planctomycetes bacterium]|nr:cation-translocating P-type ATPase [Planctomycetota bacterium]